MLVHDKWNVVPAPYYEYDGIEPAISAPYYEYDGIAPAKPAPYYGYDGTAPAYNDIEYTVEKPPSLYEEHMLPDPDPEYSQLSQPCYAYRSPQDNPEPSLTDTTPYQNAGSSGPYEGNYVGQTMHAYIPPLAFLSEYSNYNHSTTEDRLSDWWLPTMISLYTSTLIIQLCGLGLLLPSIRTVPVTSLQRYIDAEMTKNVRFV